MSSELPHAPWVLGGESILALASVKETLGDLPDELHRVPGPCSITAARYEGLWVPLFPEPMRSPIWGNGLGSIMWSDAMRVAGSDGMVILTTHPHNAYLEAGVDLGFAGLVLVCAYFVHVWRGFRRLGADPALSSTLRGFYQGAAAALASLLVAGVVDSSLAPKAEQVFLWLAIGMMYGQLAVAKRGSDDRR